MASIVTFTQNEAQVLAMQHLQYSWGGVIGRDLSRRLRTIEFRARMSAGVRTGLLKSSIRTEQMPVSQRGITGKVSANTRYAAAHHEGARPHVIRARRTRFLRFTVAGRVVFRKSVHHPGNRPNPFLARHLQEAVR